MADTSSDDTVLDRQIGLPIAFDMLPPGLDPEETEVPGVLQRIDVLLSRGIELSDPQAATLLSRSDAVNFGLWSADRRLMHSAKALLEGTQRYEKVIRNGFWNRALTWFADFNLEFDERSSPEQRLPVAELHVPHVEGCTGTFASTKSGALDVSIKAFGVGSARSRKISLSSAIDAPAICRTLTTPVEFVVHIWKHRTKDTRRALVDILAIDGSVVDEDIDKSTWHPCGTASAEATRDIVTMARTRGHRLGPDFSPVPMRKSAAGVVATHEITIEEGTIYTTAFDVPIPWPLPLAPAAAAPVVSFVIESTVSRTIKFGWKLVAGHDYLRYRAVPDDKRMFWVWG